LPSACFPKDCLLVDRPKSCANRDFPSLFILSIRLGPRMFALVFILPYPLILPRTIQLTYGSLQQASFPRALAGL
ncbi:uncharacterized protein BO96DRAFT_236491, partial [Aspergillus niger CBS 101883]|uniref:uncharacterized protein n=1 Tax=Aspergillus lacticoffeatus (strain CBS 101883) TaxID=1450533 RepID=UPI000D7F219A